MKLIIQIPCLNEAEQLPAVLRELPRSLPGIDAIEWLVIDDGSVDGTAETARAGGASVVRHARTRGLAAAFQTGLDECLKRGARLIVNLDADGQYPAEQIPALLAPILAGQAEFVIGDRQVGTNPHFGPGKRLLHRLGSAVVRLLSGVDAPDAPSGFRALSREAALRLNVLTDYTYTLETLIQAGKKDIPVRFVPVTTRGPRRPSRLLRSHRQYVLRSAATMLRVFALYEPLQSFFCLGLPFALFGGTLWLRFAWLMWAEGPQRGSHIQSVIVGGAAIVIAFLIWCLGLIGELLARSRALQERGLYLAKQSAYR